VPVAAAAAVVVVLLLRAAEDEVYYEPTSEALHRAWIARPLVTGYGLAAAVLLVAAVALAPRRWSRRTRTLVSVTAAAVALGCAVVGVVASNARQGSADQAAASSASVPTTRQFRTVTGTPSDFSSDAPVSFVRP
jgi:hypothetical protein